MRSTNHRFAGALLTVMFVLPALVSPAFVLPATAADIEPLLETLRSVGPKGEGHRQAAAAWEKLARADATQLPAILAALDGAGPLAANWIRTAVDTIAEGQLDRGRRLPEESLEKFVLDTGHAPKARRLAYEWLRRVDRQAPRRLVPKMLEDPSLEMRRDAVARLIDQGEAAAKAEQPDEAVAVYRRALAAACDLDQVRRLADRLQKLKRPVDLPRHFGFLVRWKVIGPMDNTDGKGFDAVYPPEREIDPEASYDGKHGQVGWIDHVTKDDYGNVDLNKVLVKEKAVTAYAVHEFVSKARREAEIRLQSPSAVKIWLNGRLVAAHEIYHSGTQFDQYIHPVVLRPGRNVILVKASQNAITPDWADAWGFSLRVCDHHGKAVLSTDREQ